MNTKNKIIAVLMAMMMAMAVGVPMAMSAETPGTTASVNNVATTYVVSAVTATQPGASTDGLVNFSGTATDLNGNEGIPDNYIVVWNPGSGNRTTDITAVVGADTTKTIDGADAIPYTTTPGAYTADFFVDENNDGAYDAGDTYIGSDDFNVGGVIAISVTNMVYPAVDPGETTSSNHTVTNTGNVAINFSESSTPGYDNNDPGDGILWANMSGSTDTIEDGQITITWSGSNTVEVGNTANVPFSLAVPEGTLEDTYIGSTTFTPTKV